MQKNTATDPDIISDSDIAQFNRDGFLILRNFTSANEVSTMTEVVHKSLDPPLAPLEFETDVQYPGSPNTRMAPGGNTPRRLLNAFSRDGVFRSWALSTSVTTSVRQLVSCGDIMLSQNHHNCVMTKYPGFSSATLWHQDIRYWTFDQPELVSVWLALGDENPKNGGMYLIPGSHKLELDRGRYDAAYFLRTDLHENKSLIDSAVPANLNAGDVLFFHCKTFHAAGRNESDRVKLSLVFTYRAEHNRAIAGTRSANFPDIPG